jgi:hypothetical protein
MVYFNQHIVLPAETQIYIGLLILLLFLLVAAVLFVGVEFYQLRIAIQQVNEILGVVIRLQARKVEGKKE